jgi:endo-1,4-beta-xylanase
MINQIKSIDEYDNFLDCQINKNRKGDFELTFLDSLGEPAKGISIDVKHINHDFTFGVCPNGHISIANKLACGDGLESEKYWNLIGDLFNATTLWWGWRVLEPLKEQWTFKKEISGYGPMENILERAENLHHQITAHALFYPRTDVSPQWIQDVDDKTAAKCLENTVKKVVNDYKDRIHLWHPVNEAEQPIQQVGKLKINEGAVYNWVKESDPKAITVNNIGAEIDNKVYKQGIDNAHHYGVEVDYLGVRGYHEKFKAGDVEAYKIRWNHFDDLYNKYKKKLRYTEIGANSSMQSLKNHKFYTSEPEKEGIVGGQIKCNISELNESTQSEFLVRMYKTVFAHPHMHECTYWDIMDQYTWNEVDGGIVRNDFTPKLAYYKLYELIREQWCTEKILTTDETGKCRWNGFYGTYKVAIKNSTHLIDLTRNKENSVIVVG